MYLPSVKKKFLFFEIRATPLDPEKLVNHFNLILCSGTYSFKNSSEVDRR